MAELIPIGNSNASSADIVLAAGDTATLFLKAATPTIPGDCVALIQAKADDEYFTIGQLNAGAPAQVLNATGTFRVHRPGCSSSFGVEQG